MPPASPTRIRRREWRFVLFYALIVIAVTTAPYILAWANQGDDWRFSGFLFGVEDGHSYIGKMRLGARGVWEFSLFYTSEAHEGAPLFYLPYLIPGSIVGRFVAETDPALTPALIAAFHVLRGLSNLLLIAVLYAFIAAFLRRVRDRRIALLLATFGGGFGWLLALTGNNGWLGSLPAEFYIPEAFSFLAIFGLPHLTLGRAAMLGALLALIASLRREKARAWLPYALIAGGCTWIVGFAVPFYVALVYAILGAWGLAAWISRRRFPLDLFVRCLVAGIVSLPPFAYYALTFMSNRAFMQWSEQNRLPSPHPLHYVVGYVILGGLALIAARWVWHRAQRHTRYALLIGWIAIVPLLVYLPMNVQRRMAEGVIVPLAILAAMGLRLWARHFPRGRVLRFAAIGAALVTSLFLLSGGFLAAINPGRPLFRPAGEIAAFDWLNAHSQPSEVVLASAETGNAIPAYTHLRTYIGHGPETLDAEAKTARVGRFFRGELSDAERADLLSPRCGDTSVRLCSDPIAYVIYGALERQLADDPRAWADDLTLIYDEGGYQIYRVGELKGVKTPHPSIPSPT